MRLMGFDGEIPNLIWNQDLVHFEAFRRTYHCVTAFSSLWYSDIYLLFPASYAQEWLLSVLCKRTILPSKFHPHTVSTLLQPSEAYILFHFLDRSLFEDCISLFDNNGKKKALNIGADRY